MLVVLESPLLIPVAVALVGLATLPWVLHQPTRTRVAVGLIYLGLYSFALVRADIAPFRSPAASFGAQARILVQGLQFFWWFVFARCLIAIGRGFLLYKHKLHERKFATDLLAGCVYLVVGFGAMGIVFDAPVTGLLATSGVVAIVLGLALQSTVSDVFSGIALSIEGPYRIGDAISLEGDVEGIVTEITWRATHIMTWAQDDLVVPNSVIAKSRIVNHSFPVRVHGVHLDVSLDDRTLPGRGIEMLEQALLQCRSVLRSPRPQVMTSRFGTASIGYSISFFVDRYEAAAQAKSEILLLIHRNAAWAGIPLGGRARRDMAPAAPPTSILDRLPILAELPAAERAALSAALIPKSVAAGEAVFEQGQAGDALFLVEDGVLSATRAREDGASDEIARLGPSDFFGANSVLTGAPRTATIRALTRATLFEIRKADIAPLLAQHGDLGNHLGPLFPLRAASDRAAAAGPTSRDGTNPIARLLDQITHLFNTETGV
jgi:small-conductance mechanosensitive channel/CRP-like cAMP-binding protein